MNLSSRLLSDAVGFAATMSANILTPNGKKLRACTGEECQHFGGWYQRIAEKIGPTQLVGDVLKEKDLRALYRAA
jgi:hypothetical protein